MPDIRINPLTGEYVCFSEARAKRPTSYSTEKRREDNSGECPFCSENSALLAEILELSERGNAKAVVNKYPIITERDLIPGAHEVIVDTVSHTKRLRDFTADEVFETLALIRSRYMALAAKENVKSVQIFKNQGANAGASLSHSHWQITALPALPSRLRLTSHNAEAIMRGGEGCPICEDYARKDLLISEDALCYALSPYASRFGYEISLRPKPHLSGLDGLDDAYLRSMAALLLDCARRLDAVVPGADINVLFNNPPVNSGSAEWSHFSIDIFPRRGRVGGFELLTGGHINSVYPEKAAKALKSVDIRE